MVRMKWCAIGRYVHANVALQLASQQGTLALPVRHVCKAEDPALEAGSLLQLLRACVSLRYPIKHPSYNLTFEPDISRITENSEA